VSADDDHRLLLERAPVMLWRTCAEGRFSYFNETARTFTGRSLEELLASGFDNAIHENDRAESRETRRRAFAAKRAFELEYRLRRSDGVYRVVLERGAPLYDDARTLCGFAGTCLDMHEQAAELKASAGSDRERKRLHNILLQTPVPFAMLRGPDHVYELANTPHNELFRRWDVVGKPVTEVFPEVVGTPLMDVLDHVYKSGERFVDSEFSFPLRRDGELKEAIFKFAVEPLRDESGAIEGLMVIGVEVTEQVLARWELGAALNSQKKIEAVRERLLGIVGHDLRNPLSTITVSAHMLLKQESMTAGQLKILRRILSSADRMARMISEILDFTQGRLGGGIPIVRQEIDLQEVAREAIEELEVSHPERAIKLVLSGGGQGEFDPDRMTQVISNLVSNALQYGPKDQSVNVAVRGDQRGWIEIEVHNMGPPIAQNALPHIFDPFLRATQTLNPARASRGLGLGLYIVEQIVLSHGGTIDARSTAEEGTTFLVRVPRKPAG
jgi:sigma-B regulation protein RsbU (phosphoserine phosphatase)